MKPIELLKILSKKVIGILMPPKDLIRRGQFRNLAWDNKIFNIRLQTSPYYDLTDYQEYISSINTSQITDYN